MSAIPYSILEKDGSVLLFDPEAGEGEGRTAMLFSAPEAVLRTSITAEVESILREVDNQTRLGYYAAGYVAFEAGYAFVDRLAEACPESFPFDLVWFGLYRRPLIVDGNAIIPPPLPDETGRSCDPINVMDPKRYREKIRAIRSLIERGEIYQTSYTWRARLPWTAYPVNMFSFLHCAQPAPYSAMVNAGGLSAICLSPELFFRKTGDRITAKPMKGTMPRGTGAEDDTAMRARLVSSEKERAENLMIVDLLRNDLNRICVPGSVAVPALFTVEEYPTLFQMTSTVTGTLEKGIECADVFASLFPCGSVTGAPRVRAMEIIRDMEDGPRGIYTGSIGFVSPGGDALFNVAIRTVDQRAGNASIGVGGGIVWDSDAENEYRECQTKLGFLRGRDRSFSLIESLLFENGTVPLLGRHIERMSQSAAALDFSFDEQAMTRAIDSCISRLDPARAYKIRTLCDIRGMITVEPVELKNTGTSGTIMLARERTRPDDPFLYHKTTRRGLYDRNYLGSRRLGHDDTIFMNTRGEITEGCISNIFVKKNGRIFTPPVSCGLLAGVMRRRVLETDPTAEEKILYSDDLFEADEVYICNAVRGMRKVMVAQPA